MNKGKSFNQRLLRCDSFSVPPPSPLPPPLLPPLSPLLPPPISPFSFSSSSFSPSPPTHLSPYFIFISAPRLPEHHPQIVSSMRPLAPDHHSCSRWLRGKPTHRRCWRKPIWSRSWKSMESVCLLGAKPDLMWLNVIQAKLTSRPGAVISRELW